MTNSEQSPPEYLRGLVERSVGKKTVRWKKPDCGLSPAHRFSVELEDHHRVFVKAATDEDTAKWLRNEYLALSLKKKKFMPAVIDWIDQTGADPVLITQDLSDAYWPASHQGVAWRKGDMERLLEGLATLSAIEGDPSLPELKNRKIPYWSEIAVDPAAFLSLQLCSEQWFNRSAGALIEAEKSADITGNRFVHGDIRSDNLCFLGSQVVFVDWSHAARGSGSYDLATLLPTLHLEGGPLPGHIMPEGGSQAASGSALLIKRLVHESRQMPEWLKKVFRKLIVIELEWAADCLGLDRPGGPDWHTI